MLDTARIVIRSGNGGNGAISGRREKYVPRGGPDGGHGGDGGSVFLSVDENISTLMSFRYKKVFAAGNGGHGRGGLMHGGKGDDVVVSVPVGTEVRREGKEGETTLVADLASPGTIVKVASSGRGGRGNSAFVSSINRFPLLAEEGEKGEECEVVLELKLVADVGIIGMPNAGKSSLLAAVSAARPKIGDYPFTTLEPVLGVVERRGTSFVVVDIPGLVEGAHSGVGLGHEFLRHVERTRVLVHVVDGATQDPLDQIDIINKELGLHLEALADRPQIVAINKTDLPDVRQRQNMLDGDLSARKLSFAFISAATREGVDSLMDAVLEMLEREKARQDEPQAVEAVTEVPVLRPKPNTEAVTVTRENGAYIVSSEVASRVAAMVAEEDWNARMQFYGYLKRIGVVRALEEAGVSPGDTVVIGRVEWEWE